MKNSLCVCVLSGVGGGWGVGGGKRDQGGREGAFVPAYMCAHAGTCA